MNTRKGILGGVLILALTAAIGLWVGVYFATGQDLLRLVAGRVPAGAVPTISIPTPTIPAPSGTATPTPTDRLAPTFTPAAAVVCGERMQVADSSEDADILPDRTHPYLEQLDLCRTRLSIELLDGESVNPEVVARYSGPGELTPEQRERLAQPAGGYAICDFRGQVLTEVHVFVAVGDPRWVGWRGPDGEVARLGPGVYPSAVLLHELWHAHECEFGLESSETAADNYALGHAEALRADPIIVFAAGLPSGTPQPSPGAVYWNRVMPLLDRFQAYVNEWNLWRAEESQYVSEGQAQEGYWDWLCGRGWFRDQVAGIRDDALAISAPPSFAQFHQTFLDLLDSELGAGLRKGTLCEAEATPGYAVNLQAWDAWQAALTRSRELVGRLNALLPAGAPAG